jgi:pimeloyl-ACP methyl ester carboxylesterase
VTIPPVGRVHRLAIGILVLVVVLIAGALPAAATGSRVAKTGPDPALKLTRCKGVDDARCGSVSVPLDRANPDGEKIKIAFELHPRRNQDTPALEPIVAVEGGPGYSTRASRDSYVELFAPLMNRRDLLLIDNRGTGASGAINCKKLQSYQGDFTNDVAACARRLGAAADDYGTGVATDDMVAVLDRLKFDRVNLYGDSYGTFFSQTFAVRHPERLRSLVLDAAYPIEGADPWYRDSARALRNAFRVACSRAPACAAVGGDPIQRMSALAARLRQTPITGKAKDADGVKRTVTLDAPALAFLAWSASGTPTIYRELDPAIRAALDPVDPDETPLLRLAAENLTLEAGEPVDYSEGLYAAVICHDYPQLWDPARPVAQRRAQYAASVAALDRDDPQAFAPFTNAEWIAQPYNELDYCLRWPAPPDPDPPKPAGVGFPRVPTLVLTSDLDANTSAEGGKVVARQFGATVVESANYTHVSALGDFGRCASKIVETFVRTLAPGDTSCSAHYAENRVVDHFARRAADMTGTSADDKVVRAAAATAADVIARWWSMYGEAGVGLRGGTFKVSGDPKVRFKLDGVKWVEDLAVDGTVVQQRDTGAINAQLVGRTPDGATAKVTITWNDWAPHAVAHAEGAVGGRPVDLDFPAP